MCTFSHKYVHSGKHGKVRKLDPVFLNTYIKPLFAITDVFWVPWFLLQCFCWWFCHKNQVVAVRGITCSLSVFLIATLNTIVKGFICTFHCTYSSLFIYRSSRNTWSVRGRRAIKAASATRSLHETVTTLESNKGTVDYSGIIFKTKAEHQKHFRSPFSSNTKFLT